MALSSSALASSAAAAPAAASPRAASERALMEGRADDAIAGLHTWLAANPADGQAHLLLCRAYYSEELADEAVTECEAALQTLGGSSVAQDWMGRAYGSKANRAGPIAGFKLARKVKTAFETAVHLDPANGDAANDLSEYYVGAPSLVGGGEDKAIALADSIAATLPREAHRMRGLAAEKLKDDTTAEREFKAAVALGGRADAWTDLGNFYSRLAEHSEARKDQAVDALRHAIAADKTRDAALVDVASLLLDLDREPKLAQTVLHSYLASGAKSDAAPAFKAHLLLGKVSLKLADKASARAEFNAALALAHEYAPARKALNAL